jgi:hypothetical protein
MAFGVDHAVPGPGPRRAQRFSLPAAVQVPKARPNAFEAIWRSKSGVPSPASSLAGGDGAAQAPADSAR